MLKIGPKITKIGPKMLEIRQIDPKISKKCGRYRKNPSRNRKSGTYPQNPTASPQTYWAPCAQVPQQFPALTPLLVKGKYISVFFFWRRP